MRRIAKLVLAVGMSASISAAEVAEEVYIDYDRTATLIRYKTFAIAEPQGESSLAESSPVAHRHLIGALRKRIVAGGRLTESTDAPDLYVTYSVASKEEMSLSPTGYTTGPGWRGGYYWAGSGWGAATTTATTYTAGTLVVDIWEAKAKRAVWRGVAVGVVADPSQKAIKKIDTALDRMVKQWHTMRAQGK